MAPESLAFRQTFIEIMERVQQAGVAHLEHVKRPHLFSGSWMAGITTHQQLFGQVLRFLSGPEVCLRVYNLLRPAIGLPALLGDEKLVSSFYEAIQLNDLGQFVEHDRKRQSDSELPYFTFDDHNDEGSKAARNLQRMVCVLQETLAYKDQELSSVRSSLRAANQELENLRCTGRLLDAHREASTAKHLQNRAEEELDLVRARARLARAQREDLQKELERECEHSRKLKLDYLELQKKFETALRGDGEESSWKVLYDRQREQHAKELVVLQDQYCAASKGHTEAEIRCQQLQSEVRRLRLELDWEDPEAPLPPLLPIHQVQDATGPEALRTGSDSPAASAERTASPEKSPSQTLLNVPSPSGPAALNLPEPPLALPPPDDLAHPMSPSLGSPSRTFSGTLGTLGLQSDLPLPPPVQIVDAARPNAPSTRGPVSRRTIERLAAPRAGGEVTKADRPSLLRMGCANRGRGMTSGVWR